MKNTLLQLALTIILSWLLQLFLPWWSLVVVALVIAATVQSRPVMSFSVGLVATAAVWLIMAILLSSSPATRTLPTQIGEFLGEISYKNLLYATAAIGGIMGGLAALTGTLGRNLVYQTPKV